MTGQDRERPFEETDLAALIIPGNGLAITDLKVVVSEP